MRAVHGRLHAGTGDAAGRRLVALVLVAALGCAASRSTVALLGPTGEPVHLAPTERVCVAGTEDARDGTRQFGGSGLAVSARTARGLRATIKNVQVVPDIGNAAVPTCRAHRNRWVVTATILRWEERAQGASGAPNVVWVRLVLRDLTSDGDGREIVFRSETRHTVAGRTLGGLLQSRAEPASRLLDERFDGAARALIDGGGAPVK